MVLTSQQHSKYGKYLLSIGVGCNVSKADAGETGEGEIECCEVFGPNAGATSGVVRQIGFIQSLRQIVQPAHFGLEVRPLHVRDGVEDTGQPVADQREWHHQQEQNGSSVLCKLLDSPQDAEEAKETGGLKDPSNSHSLKKKKKSK